MEVDILIDTVDYRSFVLSATELFFFFIIINMMDNFAICFLEATIRVKECLSS